MKRRVLLIDDSEFIHTFVRHSLDEQAFDLNYACTGLSGVEMAERWQPDLILLDVNMPDLNGFEICQMLKSNPATAGAPIIFLTGASRSHEKARGLALGANDYLTKPFDHIELQARIAAALRIKDAMDALSRRAMIDGLTGLWNRSYFDERLAAEMAIFNRHGHDLSCIMVDVDQFKRVNDTFGHAGGDAVLRGLAAIISAAVRREDVAARFGGEEFSILVPQTPPQGAITLAERLRSKIESVSFDFREMEISVTCSFGVADMTTAASLGGSILDRADAALYQAKALGRNRVVTVASCGDLTAAAKSCA